MQSKNAMGNLVNRYKAVLRKCHILNTFGTLVIVGALTLGAGLAHVESAFATSLDNIDSYFTASDESRTAGTLKSPYNVTLSHITAVPGSPYIDSTIESGASLTLTGQSNNLLIEDNMTNNGTLKLGTALNSATGIIGGNLTNSGTLTTQSNLKVQGDLKLNGGTATFENGLTVTGVTTLSSGTNTFTGTSTFTGDVTNKNTTVKNEFSGNATFSGEYSGSGDAFFYGETTFQDTYSNTGTSIFTNNTTFEQEYTGAGILSVYNGNTNFVNGYASEGSLAVGVEFIANTSGTVTIGDSKSMTIEKDGSLNIVRGTVDVSNGTLIVDSGATIFATGANGVLKAKATDFATNANGILTATNLLLGNVKKQLDNNGRLILTDLTGSMNYTDYKKLLHPINGLISGGTLQLENVNIDTSSIYLKDIQSGTDIPNSVVLGNDNTHSDGGTFASATAILSGVNGDMNNLGTLTLTGEATGQFYNVLVQGSALNSGILNLQNGRITGNLTNNGLVNINGATVVEGTTSLASNKEINVQSDSFTVNGTTTLNGGKIRTSGPSGNSINQATATFLPNLPNGIDGHIIAEQGSYVILGAGDSTYATSAFSTSNQDWGTNLTAALYITSPQELKSNGSIKVDGASTGIGAATANNATFAANSILVVDGKALNGNVALTAGSSNGTLTVASGAKLHIANAVSGTTVHIVSGFTDAGSSIADKAWDGDNLTNSTALQSVKVADFDPTLGTYSVNIEASSAEEIKKDFPLAQDDTVRLLGELANVFDVSSEQESIRFFSIILDDMVGIGKNNPTEATQIIESVLQIAQTGATANMAINASNLAANSIIKHLSQAGFNLAQAPNVQTSNPQTGYATGSETADNIQNGFALWMSPMYKHSSVSGIDAGAFNQGYSSDLAGISFGGDYTFQNTYRLGLAFNLGSGNAESSGDLSKTKNDFDFYGISAYGAYYNDNFTLMGDIGFSATEGELSQKVNVPNVSGLTADTDSKTFTLGVNAEYTFNTKHIDITPYVGARYTHVHTDSFNTKSALGTVAHTKADSQDILYFPIGVTFAKNFTSESGWNISPSLGLGAIVATGDLYSNSVSSIPNVAGSAEYKMQNVDKFAFDGGIGIDVSNAEKNINFGLNYNVQASKHETAHMINAMFRYKF